MKLYFKQEMQYFYDENTEYPAYLIAIKEKRDALKWNPNDLSYHVCHHSPLPSKMGVNVPFYIDISVNKLLEE